MTDKGIVFCNTCRKIVGTEFPVWDHSHGLEIRNEMLEKNLDILGYQFIKDTKKNRAYLAKHFKPRKTLRLKL